MNTFTHALTLLGILLCLQDSVATEPFHLFPLTNRIKLLDKRDIQILCKATVPITYCQFKVGDEEIFDFKMGKATVETDKYKYYGEGMETGDCGMVLNVSQLKYAGYVIGCRVRTDISDWKYAEFTLDNSDTEDVKLKDEPSKKITINQEDKNTDILVKSELPLTKCQFTFTDDEGLLYLNKNVEFGIGSKNPVVNGETIYLHGTGLQHGECGFILNQKLLDYRIGGMWIDVETSTGHGSYFTRLVLERPQEATVMNVESTKVIDGGWLTATCVVNGSRPGASIVWIFGGEEVSNGTVVVPADDDDWTWPSSLHTTVGTFKRLVNKADNGKKLQCVSRGLIQQESNAIAVRVINPPIKRNDGSRNMSYGILVFILISALVTAIR